jgi:hypothetical protein
VRRSDGAIKCSFKLKAGERLLLNNGGVEIGHKLLQKDERIISRATLVEMVKEISSSN